MKELKAGNYLSDVKKSVNLGGIIISDTEYLGKREFPAHCHENLYFAYVVRGYYNENSGRKRSRVLPGDIVLHRENEEHSNSGFSEYSRIINLEIEQHWLESNDINPKDIYHLNNNTFNLQCYMDNVIEEYIINDKLTTLGIEQNTLNMLTGIFDTKSAIQKPKWTSKLEQLINEFQIDKLNLKTISRALNVHPVHLSRDFSRYFHLSFAKYIRKVKVRKASALLKQQSLTYAAIAAECGFADQSHLIRTFKTVTGFTPNQYRAAV